MASTLYEVLTTEVDKRHKLHIGSFSCLKKIDFYFDIFRFRVTYFNIVQLSESKHKIWIGGDRCWEQVETIQIHCLFFVVFLPHSSQSM